MSDTIELLEAIGRDASLRHATSEELTNMLKRVQASEALTAAVAAGDRAPLAVELGEKANAVPQAVQTPGHEEETEHGDESHTPNTPDDGKSPDTQTTK